MIGIVSLAFGLVTPPYGLCLLIACHVAGIRVIDALKDTMIMLMPMLAVLALVILWPDFSLLLPRLMLLLSPHPARPPRRPPAGTCVDAEHPSKYAPIRAFDHLMERHARSVGHKPLLAAKEP
jgi:hypothetical protein